MNSPQTNPPHVLAMNQERWHAELLGHLSWLRSIVRARLGDANSVEDVLNDVMADALAVDDAQVRVKSPAPWLYRVAIRKTLLFRRKCGRRRRAYQAQAEISRGRNGIAEIATPLELMVHEERQQSVRDAMLRLRGQDSEILLLKYVHDWTYDSISENLGIDYWKVVHRLRRAREKLRLELIQVMPEVIED